MNTNSLERVDDMRMVDAMERYQHSLEKNEKHLHDEFMAAVRKGNPNAIASFAPMVTDYALPHDRNGNRPRRMQTVGEVMFESLGYGFAGGPSYDDVFALQLKSMRNENVATEFKTLAQRMAWAYAKYHAEANDD